MAKVGNIWIDLMANDKATSTIKSSFSGLIGMATRFGLAFSAASFVKGGISQMSDYVEAQDSLNRLIGVEGTKALTDYANKAASVAGLSKADFLTNSNNLAGLFSVINDSSFDVSDALIKVQQRVADLGSQYNKSNEDIFAGLQSGLAGRISMTLQQMGIYLTSDAMDTAMLAGEFTNLGYAANTSYESLDASTKTLLRYQHFLNTTDQSAGNFAKTLGISFPNQLKKFNSDVKNSSQNIGSSLIPTIEKLLPILEKMATFISDNIKWILGLAAAFAGFKLGGFIGQAITAIGLFVGMALGKIASETGIGALAAVPAAAAILGGIIGGVTGGVWFSGATSSSNGSTTTPEVSDKFEFNFNTITSEVSLNGKPYNSQSGLGRGGN